MIILLRVDHRLLHGQVALSWVKNLGADCILIANDDAANDEFKKTIMRLAQPQDIKMVIKTIADSIVSIKEGSTDRYKLFIVVGSVGDAKKLADGCPGITQINLGGTTSRPGSVNVSKAVYLLPTEIEQLKELIARGVEVENRMLPKDRKILFKDIHIS